MIFNLHVLRYNSAALEILHEVIQRNASSELSICEREEDFEEPFEGDQFISLLFRAGETV